jgi:hypothetical protein
MDWGFPDRRQAVSLKLNKAGGVPAGFRPRRNPGSFAFQNLFYLLQGKSLVQA